MVKQIAREARKSSVGIGPASVPPYCGGSSARSSKLRTGTRQRYPPSQYAVISIDAMESRQPALPVRLPDDVRAINIGLSIFGEAVRAQGRAALDVEWRIPAGGRQDLVAALARLYGPFGATIDQANDEVFRRLDR